MFIIVFTKANHWILSFFLASWDQAPHTHTHTHTHTRVYPNVSGLSHNEINNNNNNNNRHSLRSNTKGYSGKTHWTDSQNSYTSAPSGRKLYHLQFSLQVVSPETSGYALVRPTSLELFWCYSPTCTWVFKGVSFIQVYQTKFCVLLSFLLLLLLLLVMKLVNKWLFRLLY
jgi:hypothetical protein